MSDEINKQMLRCTLSGHLFDFNEDLGAVAIGKGAACSDCMDRLFNIKIALSPNGERPWARNKVKPRESG